MKTVFFLILCWLSLNLGAQALESDDQIRAYFQKSEKKGPLSQKEIIKQIQEQGLLFHIKVNSAGNMLLDNDTLSLSGFIMETNLEQDFGQYVDLTTLFPNTPVVYLFEMHDMLQSDTSRQSIRRCIQLIKERLPQRQAQMKKYFSSSDTACPVILISPGSVYYSALKESRSNQAQSMVPILDAEAISRKLTEELHKEKQSKTKVIQENRLYYQTFYYHSRKPLTIWVDSIWGYPDRTEVYITHFTSHEEAGISRDCTLKNKTSGEQLKVLKVRGDIGFEKKQVIPGTRLHYVLLFPSIKSDWESMELFDRQKPDFHISFEGKSRIQSYFVPSK